MRHASLGELDSQLLLAGEPGNARDFLWRSRSVPGWAVLELVPQQTNIGCIQHLQSGTELLMPHWVEVLDYALD